MARQRRKEPVIQVSIRLPKRVWDAWERETVRREVTQADYVEYLMRQDGVEIKERRRPRGA